MALARSDDGDVRHPSRSFSSDWLWVGPYPRRPPMGVRTTSGTVTWSSYISRNLAIPLTIWSKPRAMKSPNMISRIGRRPRSAIPAATPKSDASEIGVGTIRVGVAQALRDLERSAVRIEDVLTEQVDIVALGEDLVQRLVQDLHAALLVTRPPESPPARPRRRRSSPRGGSRTPPRCGLARRHRGARATVSGSRSRRTAISAGSRLSSPFECGLYRYVSRTRKNGSPVSDPRDRAPGRLVDLMDIGCLEPLPFRPRTPLRGRNRPGELELDRRRLRVVVVLDDEEDREPPERGHVQRLVRDSLSERAVAEEHRRDGAGALLLLRERDAGRDRDASEHTVGIEVPVAEVLAAALPTADTGCFPHHLAEQAERVVREREVVPVTAVVRRSRRARARGGR